MPPADPVLVVPSGLPGPSGGTTYDTRLAREWGIPALAVPGRWPHPEPGDLSRLSQVLAGLTGVGPVVIDGIVGCAAPSVVAEVAARQAPVWLLVHLPLPDETGLAPSERRRLAGLEQAALDAAAGAVVTSEWAADDLRRRYGPRPVLVAEPGTDPAPPSRGSRPPCLLTPAAYTPRKNHALLLDALGAVADRPWTARWVGPSAPGGTAAALRSGLTERGLQDRVSVEGPVTGRALDRVWDEADLLLLPSLAETYAMVVAEALAHGIPALVSAGTAAEQTLHGRGAGGGDDPAAGAALDPRSADQWAACLRSWLDDQERRAQWRRAATRRAATLPTWADTAARLLTALTEASMTRTTR
jgi:glycosyltransferase involved in cell wall biosynthesis